MESSHLVTLVRYADDAVVLCRSEADAQQAVRWLQRTAQALKLRLHPEKTRVVDLSGGADGFDFLGFHNRLVKDRKSTRLNSSHVAISYAVFCLKKKKDKKLDY